jgi:O-antigen ligase
MNNNEISVALAIIGFVFVVAVQKCCEAGAKVLFVASNLVVLACLAGIGMTVHINTPGGMVALLVAVAWCCIAVTLYRRIWPHVAQFNRHPPRDPDAWHGGQQ